MTVTDPAITLQVKEDDEVLEPYKQRPPVLRMRQKQKEGILDEHRNLASAGLGTAVSRPDPRRWRALAVLGLIQFMLVLDRTNRAVIRGNARRARSA